MKCQYCNQERKDTQIRNNPFAPYINKGILLCPDCFKSGKIPIELIAEYMGLYSDWNNIPDEMKEKIVNYFDSIDNVHIRNIMIFQTLEKSLKKRQEMKDLITVLTKDGVEEFQPNKIYNSIKRAFVESSMRFEESQIEWLVGRVINQCEDGFTYEQIQNIIELTLMRYRPEIAKIYIMQNLKKGE